LGFKVPDHGFLTKDRGVKGGVELP
jgi:hypothetical protein